MKTCSTSHACCYHFDGTARFEGNNTITSNCLLSANTGYFNNLYNATHHVIFAHIGAPLMPNYLGQYSNLSLLSTAKQDKCGHVN